MRETVLGAPDSGAACCAHLFHAGGKVSIQCSRANASALRAQIADSKRKHRIWNPAESVMPELPPAFGRHVRIKAGASMTARG
jgi:hypothetical protein